MTGRRGADEVGGPGEPLPPTRASHRAGLGRACAQALPTPAPYQVRGTHSQRSPTETPQTGCLGCGCRVKAAQGNPHLLPLPGAPQDTGLPPPLFNQLQSPWVSQPVTTRGESASPRYINKKGVAANHGASSFSEGPRELSRRARPQELLPGYQVGPDGGEMGSVPAHPPAASLSAPGHLHLCLRHLSGCRSLPCPDVVRLLPPPALRFLLPAPASTSSPPEGHPPPPASASHPCL